MTKGFYIVAGLLLVALAIWGFSRYGGRSPDLQGPNATDYGSASDTASQSRDDDSTADEPNQQAPVEHTVSYSATGFSPSTLTVKRGDKVTFVNESSFKMWVASDPHPIHTGLSGFDAGRGIASGGSYSFTFNRAGTFGYHDHLSPSRRGTIIVTD